MKEQYEKLNELFIPTDVFLKNIKKLLSDAVKDLDLKSKYSVDDFGVGCGPIVTLKDKKFILKVYGSSFGSSDKLGNCYVVMQPLCKNMEAPYNVGHIVRYSLAYFANNPKYLIENIKRVKAEYELWEEVKPHMLPDKILNDPIKYFDKLEKVSEKLSKISYKIDKLSHSRVESYILKVQNLYLTAKQKLILEKKIKCKDSGEYKDNSFIPYKHFAIFAEKRKAKIIGRSTKYFYDEKNELLFSSVNDSIEISFVPLSLKKYSKYKKELKQSSFSLHSKLFKHRKRIYTPVTRIYLIT